MNIRILPPGDPAAPALARLFADAYPVMGVNTPEALERLAERTSARLAEPGLRYVAAEIDGAPVGAMVLYDFTMNVRGSDAATGGLGSVAVSLAHKRRGIARALVAWYLEHYRARGAAFAVLHPFRPDFYRALGFGYGTPVHRFRLAPARLRTEGARGTPRLLGPGDLDALLACDERVRTRTNGLIAKDRGVVERALADPALRYVGVDDGGTLRGFMQTSVGLGPKETQNRNAVVVRDLVAEEPAHLAALLSYLRAQQDQFADVVVESQDPAFHLAATDPRDRSDRVVSPPATHRIAETGLGVMYRVLDVERAVAHLPRPTAPLTLRFVVDDPFAAATSGAWTFRFGADDAPRRVDDAPDATVRANVADLTSLVVGSLRLRDLVRHRLAAVEPAGALGRVADFFHTDEPPLCTTRF